MYIYQAIREELTRPDLGFYVTFGILALQTSAMMWHQVAAVADVSPDYHFVQQLATRCTSAQLDPRHLPDVVEDALAEEEYS